MTCIRDVTTEDALNRELENIRRFFRTLKKGEALRIEWGTPEAFRFGKKLRI